VTLVAVRGRASVPVDAAGFEALAGGRPLAVDVGTGDGRHAYHLARTRPDWFVVGLDPVADAMRESSTRAGRKPARGGLANVLYVVATVESVPAVLRGRADEVHVVLPWGRLMSGLLVADPAVVGGVAGLGRPGAAVSVVLNGEVWGDPVPVEARDLPEPTVALVEDVLAPAWERLGLRVSAARWLAADEVAALATTWARKLSHGRPHPRFLSVSASVVRR
jgi:16S rRNA (adenine(1408)-N(1))-methyltransferase